MRNDFEGLNSLLKTHALACVSRLKANFEPTKTTYTSCKPIKKSKYLDLNIMSAVTLKIVRVREQERRKTKKRNTLSHCFSFCFAGTGGAKFELFVRYLNV